MQVQQVVDEIIAATPRVRWSVAVIGRAAAAHAPDRRLRTASIGKILLLAEASRQIEAGTLDPHARPARHRPVRLRPQPPGTAPPAHVVHRVGR